MSKKKQEVTPGMQKAFTALRQALPEEFNPPGGRVKE
jgi:hypothetical protein